MSSDFHVLVVDDEEDILEMYLAVLESSGFQVTTALSGLEAIKLLPENAFDVIVTDLTMGEMDGIELVVNVKNNAKYRDIPIYIISGNLSQENLGRISSLGIAEAISKPPKMKELVARIKDKLQAEHKAVAYKPEIISMVKGAARRSLEFHTNRPIKYEAEILSKSNIAPFELSSTVTLFGLTAYGSVSLSVGSLLIEALCQDIYGRGAQNLDTASIHRILGELNHHIAGNIAQEFQNQNIHILPGIFEISTGEHGIPRKVPMPAIRIPLSLDGEAFGCLEICLGEPKLLAKSSSDTCYDIFIYDD